MLLLSLIVKKIGHSKTCLFLCNQKKELFSTKHHTLFIMLRWFHLHTFGLFMAVYFFYLFLFISCLLIWLIKDFSMMAWQSIAEAFLRMTLLFLLLLLLLMNFYQIFKESDYFENLVETFRKWKFVVGADI